MILQLFSLFFLLFTSLFGIYSCIRLLCGRMFDQNYDEKAALVLPVSGKVENLEYILRGYLQKRNFRIAVVDYGMDGENREMVSRLAARRPNLSLLTREELPVYLQEMEGWDIRETGVPGQE